MDSKNKLLQFHKAVGHLVPDDVWETPLPLPGRFKQFKVEHEAKLSELLNDPILIS